MRHILLTALFSSIIMTVHATPATHASDIEMAEKNATDIMKGETKYISSNSGVTSYFARGISGKVRFTCELKGEPENGHRVAATLMASKNFYNLETNVIITPLFPGTNGSYLWTLTNEHAENGYINVLYDIGLNVTVMCKGTRE